MLRETAGTRAAPALFDLTGKTAVVTGAAGRVGAIVCRAYAECGAALVINGRTREPLLELADELGALGADVAVVTGDVSIEDDVQGLARSARERFGAVDVLVNNVTGNYAASIEEMTPAQWDGAMAGALRTMFLCTKVFGPAMAERGRGSIVNVSSIYGNVSPDFSIYGASGYDPSPVYAAAKAGVLNLSRYVAALWGGHGVRCNSVTLGGLIAPWNGHPDFRAGYEGRTPLGRLADDEDVKGPFVFLAADASQYVTGTNLVVDGGWTAI